MLVPQPVDLSFQFIWLLLLDHPLVSGRDFLDFGQTWVGESISLHGNLDQSRVLVQSLQKDRLDIFREEVVDELDVRDLGVIGKSVDEVKKSCVVESAGAEVEFLQGAVLSLLSDDVWEVGKDLISQEVLGRCKNLEFTGRQDVADGLKTGWSNLIEGDVDLLDAIIALESLGDEDAAFITDDVATDVEDFKGGVLFKPFGDPLCSWNHQFIVVNVKFFESLSRFQEFSKGFSDILLHEVLWQIKHL